MKIEEETGNRENHLEDLCTFAEDCAESDYGGREICSSDPETCKNYFLFEKGEKGNIVIEKLPLGIDDGSIKTFPERYSNSWKQSGIGRITSRRIIKKLGWFF